MYGNLVYNKGGISITGGRERKDYSMNGIETSFKKILN